MSYYIDEHSFDEQGALSFVAGRLGYEILHAIGMVIAVVSGFVFYHKGLYHFIFGAMFVYALSMVGSALPLIRVVLWPLLMGIVLFYLSSDPVILMDIMIGNVMPDPVLGIHIGWLYLALGVIACFAIPQVGVYEGTLGLIGAALAISFARDLLRKR